MRNRRKENKDLIVEIERKINQFRRGEAAQHYADDVNRSRLALLAIIDDESEHGK